MKFYSILEGPTQDVLRRLLRLINKNKAGVDTALTSVNTALAGKATKAELKAVTDAIGDVETAGTILYRIKALEDAQTSTNTEEEETPGGS